jgi:hypothetical protein
MQSPPLAAGGAARGSLPAAALHVLPLPLLAGTFPALNACHAHAAHSGSALQLSDGGLRVLDWLLAGSLSHGGGLGGEEEDATTSARVGGAAAPTLHAPPLPPWLQDEAEEAQPEEAEAPPGRPWRCLDRTHPLGCDRRAHAGAHAGADRAKPQNRTL